MKKIILTLILIFFTAIESYSLKNIINKVYDFESMIDTSRNANFSLKSFVLDKNNNIIVLMDHFFKKKISNEDDTISPFLMMLDYNDYSIKWQLEIKDKYHLIGNNIYLNNDEIVLLNQIGISRDMEGDVYNCYPSLFRIDYNGNIFGKNNDTNSYKNWIEVRTFLIDDKIYFTPFGFTYVLLQLDTTNYNILRQDTIFKAASADSLKVSYGTNYIEKLSDSTLLIFYSHSIPKSSKQNYKLLKYNLKTKEYINFDNIRMLSISKNKNKYLFHNYLNFYIYDDETEVLIRDMEIKDSIAKYNITNSFWVNDTTLGFQAHYYKGSSTAITSLFFTNLQGKILKKVDSIIPYNVPIASIVKIKDNKLYSMYMYYNNNLPPEIMKMKDKLFLNIYDISDFTSVSDNNVEANTNYKIYPNPSSSYIDIDFIEMKGVENISIYNTFGQTLITQKAETNTQRINIEQLPSGIYYIKIGDKVAKFVKI